MKGDVCFSSYPDSMTHVYFMNDMQNGNFHLSCFSNNWEQKNPIQKNWGKAVVKSV